MEVTRSRPDETKNIPEQPSEVEKDSPLSTLDLYELAEKVLALLKAEAQIEKERMGASRRR
jgi:hypothetical protein